jgi:hypothetical protein
MINKRPIVFLAFANDRDQHLSALNDESRDVYDALQPLQQNDTVAIHREESARFDELYNDLLTFDGRIVVFHYAGHADGNMLQLEGGNGGAGGIAKLLGQQKNLKLVFLNGCATKDQVKLLHDAGVPAVIATAVKISDTKATLLATAFYKSLAKGHSIVDAFKSARGYIEGKFDNDTSVKLTVNRAPNFNFDQHEQENNQNFEFEWTLYKREDCVADLGEWRLTQAKKPAIKDSATNIASSRVSIFSGIGIGLMVGLVISLVAPQDDVSRLIVAIFMGLAGVGLAALIGLNDRHFSSAKGLRIGSFGLAVAVSALSGIYVRDNHLISPSIVERAEDLKKVFKGITNQQLIELLRDTKTATHADDTVEKNDIRDR